MTAARSPQSGIRRGGVARGGRLLAASAMALLLACGGGPLPFSGPPDPVLAPVPETSRLFYDDSPAFQDSVRIVIRDPVRFAEVWEQVTGGVTSRPTVDFERDLVIVVASGQLTPEDQIRVDSVGVIRERTVERAVQDVMTAVVVTVQGCGRFRSPAYPREIVRVRNFDGPVRFDERSRTETNCNDAIEGSAPPEGP